MIGIDTNTWLVYEGESSHGRGLWPTPVITQAKLIEQESDWLNLPNFMRIDEVPMIFREDSFDSVTRIRRGRLYQRVNSGAWVELWHNAPHPADPSLYVIKNGRVEHRLSTFYPTWNFGANVRSNKGMLLVLGHADTPTVWRIIGVEKSPSGEDLLTLRARSSFGALPEILEDQIPDTARAAVLPAIERVANGAFRSGPISLIDLCRDATVVCLGHWLAISGHGEDKLTRDLAALINTQAFNDYEVLRSSALIINRMHTRGKTNARQEKGLRIPTEEDAEAALNCFGMILRELGWAR